MAISVFDMFSIGIGPSSSHTVGPMRAALTFARSLADDGLLPRVTRVRVELFGSLGATGRGHGSDRAVILGLQGEEPETVDTAAIEARVAAVRAHGSIRLLGEHQAVLTEDDLVLYRRQSLPYHPNGMRFSAYEADQLLRSRTCYSVGGGFVVDEPAADQIVTVGQVAGADQIGDGSAPEPYPFATAADLLARCAQTGLPVSGVMLANETSRRPDGQVRARLLEIWAVMRQCVANGCATPGILPGGLKVPRRAPELYRRLTEDADPADPLRAMDWVNLFAIAVNEENAGGGRVVTAPTNGAAGVVPAVLHYYTRFFAEASDDGVVRFLLTAGAIGTLYKQNASISGAEVGCQGEVGSACSMAAGALCEVLGGTPEQVENAAEIGMEHNLGLTCDPVRGLVQVPCIERNAMAAVQAINAARMALQGSGTHVVSLDMVIKTMRETGADMKTKYKETARGGLAVNVIEC
ncbi:MAG TPA: L-serine ammonia-lyase [Trebonia sp.]|jgi:L-serine dehydratase|nr:L-serine ammonia-lyase [Trebonia sp.]